MDQTPKRILLRARMSELPVLYGGTMEQIPQQQGDHPTDLCERILERCRQRNWYGPDHHMGGFIGYYYQDGVLQDRRLTHDPRAGFEFPPATEDQLRMTEDVMGFSLPPLLRILYLRIANGGFGPDTGLIGALGGFCYWVRQDPRYHDLMKAVLISQYGEAFCQESYPYLFNSIPFDLEEHEKEYGDPRLIRLSQREWPTYFLQLCQWQSEDAIYLHARSGRLYLVTVGFGETLKGEKALTWLHRQDGSLEDWLEHWLDGTLAEQRYYGE
jgi:hypothetical protein